MKGKIVEATKLMCQYIIKSTESQGLRFCSIYRLYDTCERNIIHLTNIQEKKSIIK